ncbi:MAG TPA: XRE family transcriptional regulator [Gemmataceae bacterium]|jgi:hypothetical protein|nr:XRE family transcriptional regulator [Gemmataceae bacterium]
MDAKKRKALEAAGWRFGDAADFLGMTDEERQLLDARIEAASAVRRQREALQLSQKELASRIKTSQPRVTKIERAAPVPGPHAPLAVGGGVGEVLGWHGVSSRRGGGVIWRRQPVAHCPSHPQPCVLER